MHESWRAAARALDCPFTVGEVEGEMAETSGRRGAGPAGGDGGARLFVGVPLDDGFRHALEAHLAGGQGLRTLPGRAVPSRNWHLTLRFLGSTPPALAARLVELLREADLGPPFPLELGGLGAFPRPKRASVLWIGVSLGGPELGLLARTVEAAAREAGFAPEQRPFAAHLTLSRLDPPRDVTDAVTGIPAFGGRMTVGEVVLFRSHLGDGPARYEAVERFPLG